MYIIKNTTSFYNSIEMMYRQYNDILVDLITILPYYAYSHFTKIIQHF